MAMAEDLQDTLFKLRLPGAMRDFLEKEASKNGRTLTTEILLRLESTISGVEMRLKALENTVFDATIGNNALARGLERVEDEISQNCGPPD